MYRIGFAKEPPYKYFPRAQVISVNFVPNNMADKLTNRQKKDWAKTLYLKENITTQKELAARVGVSQNTIGKWVAEGKWEGMRTNLMLTREQQYHNILMELEQLNNSIKLKTEGKRFADAKEADARRKMIKDLKDLETKANIAEIINTSIHLVRWVNTFDVEKGKEVASLFNSFIKENLR